MNTAQPQVLGEQTKTVTPVVVKPGDVQYTTQQIYHEYVTIEQSGIVDVAVYNEILRLLYRSIQYLGTHISGTQAGEHTSTYVTNEYFDDRVYRLLDIIDDNGGGGDTTNNITNNYSTTTTATGDITLEDILGDTLALGTTSARDLLTLDGGGVYLTSYTPGDPTNLLYNDGGDLYWNGTILSSSTASVWTASGNTAYKLTGSVGIGTTTPTARLAIRSTGTTNILDLFETSGQLVMTVLENGNVGIGTSSPSAMLAVAGAFRAATVTAALIDKGGVVCNVEAYGAVGDNATINDDAIAAAIAACPLGGTVFFPMGQFRISAPIVLDRPVTLRGSYSPRWSYSSTPRSSIRADFGSFSGAAMIHVRDRTISGEAADNNGGRLENLSLDGGSASSGVEGIYFEGLVRDWKLTDVDISQVTGNGFEAAVGTGSGNPRGFTIRGLSIYSADGHGFRATALNDSYIEDLLAVGNALRGIYLSSMGETKVNNSRSVFNALEGLYIDGASNNGGITFTDFSTDRNDRHGVRISSTGTSTVVFNGLLTRRDGPNTGGGSETPYAGVAIIGSSSSKVAPVFINGLAQTVGYDDSSNPPLAPTVGVRVTNATYVKIDGQLWGVTDAYSDDGGNDNFIIEDDSVLRTGTAGAQSLYANVQKWQSTTTGLYYGNGSVSIGSSTSNSRLLTIIAPAKAGARFQDTTNNVIFDMRAEDFQAFFGTFSNHQLRFQTNNLSRMTIDTNGRVGIGTTSPTSILTVRATGTTDVLNLFETSGTEIFTVLESGRVGIGSTSPSRTLSVTGDVSFTGQLDLLGSTANIALGSNWLSGDGDNEGVFVTSDGKVGIGNSGPSTAFDVGDGTDSGTHLMRIYGDTSNIVIGQSAISFFDQNAASTSLIMQDSGLERDLTIGNANFNALIFGTNNTERMRIAANGNVSIGTTTTDNGLTVEGTFAAHTLSLYDSDTLSFTTPGSASVQTKIAVPLFDPGAFGQVMAMGLPASAETSARVISLFDARASAHQPTIGVFSPDESNLVGFSWDGSNATSYLKTTGGNLGFKTGSTDLMTLLSTGNVGIGTTSPVSILSIADNQNSPTRLTIANLTDGTGAEAALRLLNSVGEGVFGLTSPSITSYGALAGDNLYAYNFGDITLMADGGSANINFATGAAGAQTMILDGNGYLGIGTTTPSQKLSVVAGNLGIDYGYGIKTNSSVYDDILTTGWNGSQDYTSLYTAGTGAGNADAKITMLSSGYIGIATTTPTRTLTVDGTVGFSNLTGAVGAGSLCLTSGGEVVYNSGSDNCLSSTADTKHSITDLEFSTSTIMALLEGLTPVSFIYNNDITDRVRYGFIADEALKLDEHLVTYNLEGEVTGLDTNGFLATIVAAVKQLYAMVTGNQERIAELEERIEVLEGNAAVAPKTSTKSTSNNSTSGSSPSTPSTGTESPSTDTASSSQSAAQEPISDEEASSTEAETVVNENEGQGNETVGDEGVSETTAESESEAEEIVADGSKDETEVAESEPVIEAAEPEDDPAE